MDIDELQPNPNIKLVPLGHIVLQSLPLTKEEADVWLQLIAKQLPPEMFTLYSWVPLLPGDTN